MPARLGLLASVCLAVLAAAGAAGATGTTLVVVRPHTPVAGLRTTIEVRAEARHVALELVSPTQLSVTLPMRRVAPGLWRLSFRFTDDGTWLLRVPLAGRHAAVRRVFVQQPPAGLPPFRFARPGTSTLEKALAAAIGLP